MSQAVGLMGSLAPLYAIPLGVAATGVLLAVVIRAVRG